MRVKIIHLKKNEIRMKIIQKEKKKRIRMKINTSKKKGRKFEI